jgi:cell division transport system permease protein
MINLRRIIKAGFINFRRGGLVSWAAVLIVTITLSVIAALFMLQAVLSFSLAQIEEKVDVTIYFSPASGEEKIMLLKASLEKLPEVAEVSYTSAEEALRLFRERHKNDYITIQALDELRENPLGASLAVRAKEVSQYETIASFLGSENARILGGDIVEKVNYHQNKLVIDRLNSLISGGKKLGFLITLILIIISIIITFNTIRLTIFIVKDEIGVMRLVGASNMDIRGPFMVEGAIYGVIATLATLVLFWPITSWLGRSLTGFWGINLYEYYLSNFFQILILILFSGVALGMISSFLAIRKYLNP